MNRDELNLAKQRGNIEKVAPPPNDPPEPVRLDTQEEFRPVLTALRRPKQHLEAAPTSTPRTFEEHFQFVDTGSDQYLYIYINGTWERFVPA